MEKCCSPSEWLNRAAESLATARPQLNHEEVCLDVVHLLRTLFTLSPEEAVRQHVAALGGTAHSAAVGFSAP